MTQTTPDTCTWRDLADQLTPEQIARLAELEQRSTLGPRDTRAALLRAARYWAQFRLTDDDLHAGDRMSAGS